MYRVLIHAAPPGTGYMGGDLASFSPQEASRIAVWLYRGYATLESIMTDPEKPEQLKELGSALISAVTAYGLSQKDDMGKIQAIVEAVAAAIPVPMDLPQTSQEPDKLPDANEAIPDEATLDDYRVVAKLPDELRAKLDASEAVTVGDVRKLSDADLRDQASLTAKELKAVRQVLG